MEKENAKSGGAHSGHRARLIEKMNKQTLCDHEYLEALLFNAVPRRNTNDLAHRLIARFGGVAEILSASVGELKEVEGIGESLASYLHCVGVLVEKYSGILHANYAMDFNYTQFFSFIKREYAWLKTEIVDVYLLDDTGFVYAKRRFTSDNVHAVEFRVRQLTKILIEDAPAGIILVHNHPHGKAEPSKADDKASAEMQYVCEQNGVVFCDHFIYAPSGIYSYNFSHKIANLKEKYQDGKRAWLKAFLGGAYEERE